MEFCDAVMDFDFGFDFMVSASNDASDFGCVVLLELALISIGSMVEFGYHASLWGVAIPLLNIP